MMIYSAYLHTLKSSCAHAFPAVFRDGGLWHDLARLRLPGYIGTSALQHQQHSSQWLVLHFWTTEEAHAQALRSPTMAALEALTLHFIYESRHLGVFLFPPRIEREDCLYKALQLMTARIAN